MSTSNGDNGIPLLTEVLVVPALETPAPAASTELVIPSLDFDIPDLLTASELAKPAEPQWNAHDWERMEADISERISRQVLGRVDFVLEQRVRDSLADVLQVAVEGLAREIKRGLHQTIEEVIARAVAQEISRLQNEKN